MFIHICIEPYLKCTHRDQPIPFCRGEGKCVNDQLSKVSFVQLLFLVEACTTLDQRSIRATCYNFTKNIPQSRPSVLLPLHTSVRPNKLASCVGKPHR